MWKSLAIIFLAGALVTEGASTSFAADAANPGASTAPGTGTQQPSRRTMHRMQQSGEDQTTGGDHAKVDDQNDDQDQGDDQDQHDDQAEPDQAQTSIVTNPSQRARRQQLREATRNQATGAGRN